MIHNIILISRLYKSSSAINDHVTLEAKSHNDFRTQITNRIFEKCELGTNSGLVLASPDAREIRLCDKGRIFRHRQLSSELDVHMVSHILKELTREEVSKVCYSNIHNKNVQARTSQQHNREGDLVRKL